MRELHLECLELGTPLGTPVDEDVTIEARLGLESETRRAVEESLRLIRGQVGEQRRLSALSGLILPPCVTVAAACKCIDVSLAEGPLFRGLVLESGRIAREISCEHVELRGRPIPSEEMTLR